MKPAHVTPCWFACLCTCCFVRRAVFCLDPGTVPPGKGVVTGPGDLRPRGVRHILHAVAPSYRGPQDPQCVQEMASCVNTLLAHMQGKNLRSASMPLLGAGGSVVFCNGRMVGCMVAMEPGQGCVGPWPLWAPSPGHAGLPVTSGPLTSIHPMDVIGDQG